MSLIQTGQQITRTIRNAGRLKTIVSVFAGHGFADLASRIRLGRYILEKLTESPELSKRSVPERVRRSFEELGPTFVKLGQVLAARPDLVPENFVEEFSRLQAQVNPLPFSELESVLVSELGDEWKSYFSWVEEKPLGSASIAQVHRARLSDQSPVVLKIQRPGVESIVDEDLSILYFIAELLEKYIPETRNFKPIAIVAEFEKLLSSELNFIIEANNIRRFTKNFEDNASIVIPKVYWHLSTQKVLIMEELLGTPLSDPQALETQGVNAEDIIQVSLKAFIKMVFQDGLFHGDLHPGNFLILPGNRVGLIDFGAVGRLSRRTQSAIAAMLLAISREDYDRLATEYIQLSPYSDRINAEVFARELRDLVAPYLGLSSAQFNVGMILLKSSGLSQQHGVSLPTELVLFFKSMIAVEGMGRRIKNDFDFVNYTIEMSNEVIKTQLEPFRISSELERLGMESRELLFSLPKQLNFLLRRINSPSTSLKLNIQNIEDIQNSILRLAHLSFWGLIIASLILASALSAQMKLQWSEISSVSWVGFAMAITLIFFVSLRSR